MTAALPRRARAATSTSLAAAFAVSCAACGGAASEAATPDGRAIVVASPSPTTTPLGGTEVEVAAPPPVSALRAQLDAMAASHAGLRAVGEPVEFAVAGPHEAPIDFADASRCYAVIALGDDAVSELDLRISVSIAVVALALPALPPGLLPPGLLPPGALPVPGSTGGLADVVVQSDTTTGRRATVGLADAPRAGPRPCMAGNANQSQRPTGAMKLTITATTTGDARVVYGVYSRAK